MRVPSPARFAALAALLGGLACAQNNPDSEVGAARDTTSMGDTLSDSARANQTKSGVTDTKTGESTLGPKATQTRPDQGEPVTSKGDTLNPSVDSATTDSSASRARASAGRSSPCGPGRSRSRRSRSARSR